MSDQMLQGYLIISAMIFCVGGLGVLLRRSPLVVLMCIELMWAGAALAFMAFARYLGTMDGHIFTFMIITVAAAKVAIGLAIIVSIFRRRDAVDIDDIHLLRG